MHISKKFKSLIYVVVVLMRFPLLVILDFYAN